MLGVGIVFRNGDLTKRCRQAIAEGILVRRVDAWGDGLVFGAQLRLVRFFHFGGEDRHPCLFGIGVFVGHHVVGSAVHVFQQVGGHQ